MTRDHTLPPDEHAAYQCYNSTGSFFYYHFTLPYIWMASFSPPAVANERNQLSGNWYDKIDCQRQGHLLEANNSPQSLYYSILGVGTDLLWF